MNIQDLKSIHVRETIYQSVVNNVLLFRPETMDVIDAGNLHFTIV